MRLIFITALTLVAGVSGGPIAAEIPQVQIEGSRLFPNLTTILPDLLHTIQHETSAIDNILDQHPGPIVGDAADKVAGLIGIHLHNITDTLHDARGLLGSLTNETKLVDENGLPCNVTCIIDKTKNLVKHVGGTAHRSLLKVGLHALGKSISPFFLALSAIVLVINAVVGGALAALAALVNGIGFAIAAGIAYLGHLVSEKEKQTAGGPGGNITQSIGHFIGEVLHHKLANLNL
ncbi:hypothetical protein KVR01_002347 [Diaporthe batatas]|uniref:uncharacterized protein n=1 Tax=Diaporthe batatas TaxID=748121 RepID=UPI001D03FABB|nr:uncharacterized protein KVR01_002347 [Diaporthe batatas]KAG8166658.1 hypothetical protein KVR01_002347 [Diaporthe batatas]